MKRNIISIAKLGNKIKNFSQRLKEMKTMKENTKTFQAKIINTTTQVISRSPTKETITCITGRISLAQNSH